jgi:hypothetical protein
MPESLSKFGRGGKGGIVYDNTRYCKMHAARQTGLLGWL